MHHMLLVHLRTRPDAEKHPVRLLLLLLLLPSLPPSTEGRLLQEG
jgi:hypothetical protein